MPSSRTISANGLDFFIAEQGQGPLVLLCHGWPELSYSWRHQIPAIAEAGFHVVAPDMRGFGRTGPDTLSNAPSTSSQTSSRAGSTGPGIFTRPLGMREKPQRW